MAVKYQGGKAVPAKGATKAGRDAQLHKLMDELRAARERIFQASQRLIDFDIPGEVWNAHVEATRKFYAGVDAVYNDAARMLHAK